MKFFNKGFTLIEVVAVIGVLAITSGILLVNTRTTEVQLNLSQDTANVASAINRAKALTIQNLEDGICGYGVHFAPGDSNAPDKYIVFKDKDDCNNVSYSKNDEILSGEGGENELNSELEFESNEHDMVIRDIIFYSSDARVKLISTETNKSNIDPTGIIIIKTKTTPVSYMTLKINVTGQVSKMDSKTEAGEGGEYNIDNIVDDIFNGDGDGGSGIGDDNGSGIIDDDCIPNCSCVIGLASGETCSDGCRGICYAGQDPWNPFGCALPLTNPHSICVNDVCISNNICGFTDCSGCGGSCVIPGQTNPHSTCVNNVCTSNNICGFTDCSSCGGVCIPTPGICNEKTCADVDDCDPPVPCVVCDFGFGCVGEEGAGVCELCIDCEEEGKVCGDDNGCGNVCQNCPVGESCVEQVDDSWKCETQGSGLILIGVEPAGANN